MEIYWTCWWRTVIIEMPFWLLGGFYFFRPFRLIRWVIFVLAVNLVTNPVAVWSFLNLRTPVLVVEGVVFLAEGIACWWFAGRCRPGLALLLATAINFLSWKVGTMV